MEQRESSGIVIKQVNWSDSSKIITVFSKDFGKIQLIARGAKRPKSKYIGIVDLLNVIHFQYQFKVGRDLNHLGECELERSMQPITENYDHYIIALAMIELIEQLMELDDSHQFLYEQCIELITLLRFDVQSMSVLIRFLTVLIQELGFELNMKQCANCGAELKKQYQYHIEYGILCENCLNPNVSNQMSGDMFAALYKIQYADFDTLARLQQDNQVLNRLTNLLISYLENHINKALNLKSLKRNH